MKPTRLAMTRFALRLPQRQARLVALAIAYHLARHAQREKVAAGD